MTRAVALASCFLCAVAAGKPPHVIFNVIDDWGYNDVGFHSSAPGADVITPYIDSLARGGVRLSDYNVFRFCSPSRSTFLSGRMPYHIGQQTGMNLNPMPGIACGINTAYHFLPQVLRDNAGYRSYALGKWHVGFYNRSQTATYRGFESYLGYYSGAEEHFTHKKAGCRSNFYDLANNTGAQGTIAPADSRLVGDNGTYSVWLYGNESVRLIHAHDADTPLYMYLAWNVVHAPCEAPQHYIDRHAHIEDKGRRNFAAMLSSLDEALPQVIDALKAKNMWQNTVFIVTTDNGGNLGGSGNNWPLRGGKFTFWQGGVRGNAFINSPLLPEARLGGTWSGLAHAADWYTTIAELAGVPPEQVGINNTETGPVPPDGVALWDAISSNSSSPRAEVVINIDAQSGLGVLRQGKWKLIDGYPGNGHTGWDGWVPLPNSSNGLADAKTTHWLHDADVLAGPYLRGDLPLHGEADRPCSMSPCLFDVLSDPEERNDVAAANPAIVKAMLARLAELGKSEVTIDESGLCPFVTGTKSDCQCAKKAKENGYWMPWCDAGYSCEVAPTPTPAQPTPQPVPTPPTPAPAPTDTCSAEARAKPPQVFAEVRADAPLADAGQMQAKQAWDIIEHQSAGNMTVIVQLRNNSSLCMGVSGHTLRNPQTADVRLLHCDATDPAQLWRRVETRDAQIPSEFGLAPVLLPTGALDLQQGKVNMCAIARGNRDFNDNERFAYNETVGLLSLTRKTDLIVDVC